VNSTSSGEIVLHRSKSYRDRFRKYEVLVDGKQIGHISAGEVKIFAVPPGEHELELKIDWKGSPVLNLKIAPGDRLHFACGGKGASSALFDLFRRSDAWVRLEPLNDQSRS
jgi:hypothetical protein